MKGFQPWLCVRCCSTTRHPVRLEEDDSWFEGMKADEREVDGHVQAELMRRLTAPTGSVRSTMTRSPEAYEHRSTATSSRTCTARRTCMCCGSPASPTSTPWRSTTGDQPDVMDRVSGHRRGAQRPSPTGHQDRGGVQYRVRRAARVQVIGAATTSTSSCCRSKSVRSSRRRDLRDRVDAVGRRGRRRGDGRRQRGGRRRRRGARLRVPTRRSAADVGAT